MEAANASEDEFGEERLRVIIQENCARSSPKILNELLGQVRAYIREEALQDDMTLVVARIH